MFWHRIAHEAELEFAMGQLLLALMQADDQHERRLLWQSMLARADEIDARAADAIDEGRVRTLRPLGAAREGHHPMRRPAAGGPVIPIGRFPLEKRRWRNRRSN